MIRPIELLAPARNLECGIEAIKCGADAVYIGAPQFGARVAAGNSVEDIAQLVSYAHLFGVKVYVTLNTILYNDEIESARQLAMNLYEVGVDALITQDFAYHEMHLPIALNASTQMDNRSADDVLFLRNAGYRRVILARELSIREINAIHEACPEMELEAFVHGALCVSYSGQCYASQYCFSRSANRGACAQFCRLAFNLEDADGNVLLKDKHLLSLKDMNRSRYLEEMMDAGICSFKIEGRLKDVAYVKNVTAYYRKEIDNILKHRPEYRRSSFGKEHIGFEPQLDKTFNRGFTEYFLHGRAEDVASFDTPKSVGEPVGHVKSVHRREVKIAGVKAFHNGDGLCFIDDTGKLCGFRVNKVENNVLLLSEPCRGLKERMPVYRNYDAAFIKLLGMSTSDRTLKLDLLLKSNVDGFTLTATDEMGLSVEYVVLEEKQEARSPQYDRIVNELSKLGGTVYSQGKIEVQFDKEYFIPAARVAQWRRDAQEMLNEKRKALALQLRPEAVMQEKKFEYPLKSIDYSGNVSNRLSQSFYKEHDVTEVAAAFELSTPVNPTIMTCRHCIRYSLGGCVKYGGKRLTYSEPLYLRMSDGRKFRLSFNCSKCEMSVSAE